MRNKVPYQQGVKKVAISYQDQSGLRVPEFLALVKNDKDPFGLALYLLGADQVMGGLSTAGLLAHLSEAAVLSGRDISRALALYEQPLPLELFPDSKGIRKREELTFYREGISQYLADLGFSPEDIDGHWKVWIRFHGGKTTF